MDLGIHYIDFLDGDPALLGPTLASTAKAAEDEGMALFTLGDHLLQVGNLGLIEADGLGAAADPYLEGYTALGFLAASTQTIELAMLVGCVTFRHPGVLGQDCQYTRCSISGTNHARRRRWLVRT